MTELVLDPSQERAVDLVMTAKVGVITGGPGTGKSTCLRTALDRLDAQGGRLCTACDGQGFVDAYSEYGFGDSERCLSCVGTGRMTGYALAAPTGKAARRLSEVTGREACTVHRLLAYGPLEGGGVGFRRNEYNPLESELVVVDEASMLDVALAAALLKAVDPQRTRLVLVGDVNQLPSVGPGRVFGDLITSDAVPVARLTQLHRAAAESWVCTQAPVILDGDVPEMGDRHDFLWFNRDDRDEAAKALVDVVTKALPAKGVAPRDVQVLVPQKVGPAGTEGLNTRLQALLNKSVGPSWKCGPYQVRAGDQVIQTVNDYSRLVMNGESGVVEEIRESEVECDACEGTGLVFGNGPEGMAEDWKDVGRAASPPCPKCLGQRRLFPGLVVRFPDGRSDRRVTYTKIDADRMLALAYALTIHKSQGSEWPWVVVFVHSTHTKMLTRQLLYTAITRAKKGVVIVGDMKGLERAVAETKDVRRNTALVERLRAA